MVRQIPPSSINYIFPSQFRTVALLSGLFVNGLSNRTMKKDQLSIKTNTFPVNSTKIDTLRPKLIYAEALHDPISAGKVKEAFSRKKRHA